MSVRGGRKTSTQLLDRLGYYAVHVFQVQAESIRRSKQMVPDICIEPREDFPEASKVAQPDWHVGGQHGHHKWPPLQY